MECCQVVCCNGHRLLRGKERFYWVGEIAMKHIIRHIVFSAIALAIVLALVEVVALSQGKIFPVVSKAEILGEVQTPKGVAFYLRFTKNYNCEFVGVNWYLGDHRLRLEFLEDHGDLPLSRPSGDQHAGPWLLHGVSTLAGTRASVVHRCAPGLWETHTDFYP